MSNRALRKLNGGKDDLTALASTLQLEAEIETDNHVTQKSKNQKKAVNMFDLVRILFPIHCFIAVFFSSSCRYYSAERRRKFRGRIAPLERKLVGRRNAARQNHGNEIEKEVEEETQASPRRGRRRRFRRFPPRKRPRGRGLRPRRSRPRRHQKCLERRAEVSESRQRAEEDFRKQSRAIGTEKEIEGQGVRQSGLADES